MWYKYGKKPPQNITFTTEYFLWCFATESSIPWISSYNKKWNFNILPRSQLWFWKQTLQKTRHILVFVKQIIKVGFKAIKYQLIEIGMVIFVFYIHPSY